VNAFDSEIARLRSTVSALEQLIEVLEATALHESARRDATLAELSTQYEREHHIAETLQRSLLPDHIPSPAGTTIATRYFPGASGTRVGGDWYDVVPLPHGRMAVVLGDVVGHGLRAAATMGQLRAALRAYAVIDSDPVAVLKRVEHLLDVAGDVIEGYVATLFYAVVDPVALEMHYISAGHPAPVLLSASGEARLVEGGLTVPLGLGGSPLPTHRTETLEVGSTLLMYTDGLIERRGESLNDGLKRLLGACTSADAESDLDRLCDSVVATMSEAGSSDDDVALLAVRLTGTSISRSWELVASPASAGLARRAVASLLREAGRQDLEDAAELITSELVTNAVRHAGTEVRVDVRIDLNGTARIGVYDGDSTIFDPAGVRSPAAGAEGGRGLVIVAALAQEWGVDLESTGKTVWCTLAASP